MVGSPASGCASLSASPGGPPCCPVGNPGSSSGRGRGTACSSSRLCSASGCRTAHRGAAASPPAASADSNPCRAGCPGPAASAPRTARSPAPPAAAGARGAIRRSLSRRPYTGRIPGPPAWAPYRSSRGGTALRRGLASSACMGGRAALCALCPSAPRSARSAGGGTSCSSRSAAAS